MAHPPAPRTRSEAQRRADRIRAFQAELAEAERDGALVLTPEQRARLEAYHAELLQQLAGTFDVDVSEQQKRLSLGMVVVATAGAVAFAASLVLFVFRIWGRLSVEAQVALLVAAPLAAAGAADLTARRRSLRVLTGLFALVAFAGFVLNLEQLGHLFAFTPAPEALLAYAVFAGLLAYAYGQPLLLLAGAALLAVYLAAAFVRVAGGWWPPPGLFWRLDGFLVGGALVLVWSALPHRTHDDFPPLLRDTGVFMVSLVTVIVGQAPQLSWLPFAERAVAVLYQVLSFAVPGAAVALAMRRGWTSTMAVAGLFVSVALFVKYVDWWWDRLPAYLFFLVVGATALGLLWLFGRARARARALA